MPGDLGNNTRNGLTGPESGSEWEDLMSRWVIFLVLLGLAVGAFFLLQHFKRQKAEYEPAEPTVETLERSPRPVPSKEPKQRPDRFAELDIPQVDFDIFVNGLPAEPGVNRLVPGGVCVTSFDGHRYSHEWIAARAGETYTPALRRIEERPVVSWRSFQGGVQRRGLVRAPDRHTLNCAYTVALGDEVEASPVGWQGAVLVSSEHAAVTAVDVASGQVLWTRGDMGSGVTPVIVDEHVFCATDRGDLMAFRLQDGKEREALKLGSYATSLTPLSNSEILVTTGDQRVLVLEIKRKFAGRIGLSPRLEKHHAALERSTGNPAVFGQQAVFHLDSGGLFSISLVDGSRVWPEAGAGREAVEPSSGTQWEVIESGGGLTPSPAVSGNRVFCLDGKDLVAADCESGAQLWRKALASPGTTSLAVAYDTVYFGGADGIIRAHSTHNGAVVFQTVVSKRPLTASPVVFGDKLVVATGEGEVLLLHAFVGQILNRNDTLKGHPIRATPIVTDQGVIAINQTGDMACFR